MIRLSIIPIATHDPRSTRAAVSILPTDLLRSAYVVGKTGTGKSTLLENLLLRAVDAGFGAALIDPHGDLADRVLSLLPTRHRNNVIVLRPSDAVRSVGLNLFAVAPGTPRALVASAMVEVFRTLWGRELFGPRSEHVLRYAVLALLETPAPTLLGLVRLLTDESYRMRVVSRVEDPVTRSFWLTEFPSLGKFATEVTAPVLNKLGALSSPVVRRVVAQTTPRLRLREVMDEGRILICDLSGIGRDATALIGALLVSGLDIAAHLRAGTLASERRPFLLVADEFQTYITRSFLSILAESRKFGLAAVLAHQHAAQLEPEVRAAILGNAGTLASFAVSAEDAKTLAPEFGSGVAADDLVRLRRHHLVLRLLRKGEPRPSMVVRTLPPERVSGSGAELLMRMSAERYGRAIEVVDREIAEAIGMRLLDHSVPPN